ncbi:hypothetical protein [Maricaulis sp.]|uniref:hypothetical protein n=1 Tax=Maricaulis sp. TaxID=1486257 RepID=UPI003A8E79FA
MAKKGQLSRRSFLAQVAGSLAITSALSAVTGCASVPGQTGQSDNDLGVNADPAGQGRGGARNGAASGIRDSDSGANGDRAGCCRPGSRSGSGVTDSDTGTEADPVGQGRGAAPQPD